MLAEYVKTVEVAMPDDSINFLEVYIDPRTKKLFGIASEFVEASPGVEVTSPFNKHVKLELP